MIAYGKHLCLRNELCCALVYIILVLTNADAGAQDRMRSLVTLYVTTGAKIKIGTGFSVKTGLIATAYHVIQGARRIEIVPGPGSATTDVTVRNIFPEKDLAILEVKGLGDLPPLEISDRIPNTDEDLSMLGSALGLPGQTYSVRVVQSKLVPVRSFNDTTGKPLFEAPPAIDVLQIAGVVYGGMSGGPLADRKGAVLGVLSGSLSEGGTYGWAIPSKDLEAALSEQPDRRQVADITDWPAIPFRSSHLRTTEFFVREDSAAQADFATFTARANHLNGTNSQIELNAGLLASDLTQDAIAIQSVVDTPRLPGMSPLTPSELNSSIPVTMRVGMFANALPKLRKLRKDLSDRYEIDRALRQLISRLNDVATRPDVNPGSARRIQSAAQQINGTNSEVASDTYEGQNGVDEGELLDGLDQIIAQRNFRFTDVDAAKDFADTLESTAEVLREYDVSRSFGTWVPAEHEYFSQAAKLLQRFYPVIVYVPE